MSPRLRGRSFFLFSPRTIFFRELDWWLDVAHSSFQLVLVDVTGLNDLERPMISGRETALVQLELGARTHDDRTAPSSRRGILFAFPLPSKFSWRNPALPLPLHQCLRADLSGPLVGARERSSCRRRPVVEQCVQNSFPCKCPLPQLKPNPPNKPGAAPLRVNYQCPCPTKHAKYRE